MLEFNIDISEFFNWFKIFVWKANSPLDAWAYYDGYYKEWAIFILWFEITIWWKLKDKP